MTCRKRVVIIILDVVAFVSLRRGRQLCVSTSLGRARFKTEHAYGVRKKEKKKQTPPTQGPSRPRPVRTAGSRWGGFFSFGKSDKSADDKTRRILSVGERKARVSKHPKVKRDCAIVAFIVLFCSFVMTRVRTYRNTKDSRRVCTITAGPRWFRGGRHPRHGRRIVITYWTLFGLRARLCPDAMFILRTSGVRYYHIQWTARESYAHEW